MPRASAGNTSLRGQRWAWSSSKCLLAASALHLKAGAPGSPSLPCTWLHSQSCTQPPSLAPGRPDVLLSHDETALAKRSQLHWQHHHTQSPAALSGCEALTCRPAPLAACCFKPPRATPFQWAGCLACVQASLKRFQLDYVDLLFCHRPDVATPIEETVRAMNWCIDQVGAFVGVKQ